jgi:hypothetical protein
MATLLGQVLSFLSLISTLVFMGDSPYSVPARRPAFTHSRSASPSALAGILDVIPIGWLLT